MLCILQPEVCFLSAAEAEATPYCLVPSPSTSLLSAAAAAAAAASLDSGPANVQPGQLGAVFKELLNGDVTYVQLGCQRVLLLHGDC